MKKKKNETDMYSESSIQLSNIPAIYNLFEVPGSPKGDLTGGESRSGSGRNGWAKWWGPLCVAEWDPGVVATATEIEPGAHDGSANPTTFSVVVRSHVREVLHAPVRLICKTCS